MYLNEYSERIRREVPPDLLPAADTDALFRGYASLLLAKGSLATLPDVHNVWVAWMAGRDETHPSLVPFEDLSASTAAQDQPFLDAIHRVAAQQSALDLDPYLFPRGVPTSGADRAQAFELYKFMVASSEALVGRRQTANAFFLTLNGALLTGIGLIVGQGGAQRWQASGVVVLTVTGLVLSQAWISLIHSFARLNAGKFAVINRLETLFSAAIYLAEWKALEESRNTKRYRTFTSREVWVPYLTSAMYAAAAIAGLVVALGWAP